MSCFRYLNLFICVPCGALTSKPFAFQYRPWELRTFEFNDIFDTFLTKLRFDFFNTNGNYRLTRVVPFVPGWITNKTRFGYFDLFNSTKPLASLHLDDGRVDLTTSRLFKFISIFKNYLSLINFKTTLFCGNFVDINFQNKIKLLGQFDLNRNFYYNKSFSLSNFCLNRLVDLRPNFFLNNQTLIDTKLLSSQSILVLSGLNLRFESPLLNLRAKKLVNTGVLKIIGLGFVGDLGYFYLNSGVLRSSSLSLLKGRHILSNLFKSSNFCWLFYGSKTSFSPNLLHFYWKSLNLFFINVHFFSPVFLTNEIGLLQYLEIGGGFSISNNELSLNNIASFFLNILLNPFRLDTNTLEFFLMNSVLNIVGSILPNSFEELNLKFIDLVLPLDSVLETNNSYFLNMFGECIGFNSIKPSGLNKKTTDDFGSYNFIDFVFNLFNENETKLSKLNDYISPSSDNQIIFSLFMSKLEIQIGVCFVSTNFILSSVEFCNFYSDNFLTGLKLNNF